MRGHGNKVSNDKLLLELPTWPLRIYLCWLPYHGFFFYLLCNCQNVQSLFPRFCNNILQILCISWFRRAKRVDHSFLRGKLYVDLFFDFWLQHLFQWSSRGIVDISSEGLELLWFPRRSLLWMKRLWIFKPLSFNMLGLSFCCTDRKTFFLYYKFD